MSSVDLDGCEWKCTFRTNLDDFLRSVLCVIFCLIGDSTEMSELWQLISFYCILAREKQHSMGGVITIRLRDTRYKPILARTRQLLSLDSAVCYIG